jgi:hypothetical protein
LRRDEAPSLGKLDALRVGRGSLGQDGAGYQQEEKAGEASHDAKFQEAYWGESKNAATIHEAPGSRCRRALCRGDCGSDGANTTSVLNAGG